MHPVENDIQQRFSALPGREDTESYNFEHFRLKHLVADFQRSVANAGIAPGEVAPDFTLPSASVETFRLIERRGKPVLLHFGSYT